MSGECSGEKDLRNGIPDRKKFSWYRGETENEFNGSFDTHAIASIAMPYRTLTEIREIHFTHFFLITLFFNAP